MTHSIRLWLMISLFMGVLGLTTFTSYACSVEFTTEISLKDYVESADVIMIGTVLNGPHPMSATPNDVYELHVEQYLKGDGRDLLHVNGYGTSIGDCLNGINPSDRRLMFFIDGDPQTDGVLKASYLRVYDAVWEISGNWMRQISRMVGHDPITPTQTYPNAQFPAALWVVIAVAAGAVILKLRLS